MKKKFIIASAVVLALFVGFGLQAQAKTQGAIYVKATANADLQPDTAEFNVVVRTKDKTSLEAAAVKNKEINLKITEYFNGLLDKKKGEYIKTIDYSARPIYNYKDGKQVFDRYEVVNTLTVHTKQTEGIGKFIDNSLHLGATDIGGINFMLEATDMHCANLLAEATNKAKTKAQAVANASGQRITGIKEIRTNCNLSGGRNYPRYMNSKMMLMSAGATNDMAMEETSTSVEGGAIKLYATIDADFYAK